jgi:uncharacterized Zn-finger protein
VNINTLLPSNTTLAYTQNNQLKSLIKCTGCDIIFSRKDALTRHLKQNKCKKTCIVKENDIELIKKEMEENKKYYEKEMERLRDIIQKSLKIHPKTLHKINNTLNSNNTINNNLFVQLWH